MAAAHRRGAAAEQHDSTLLEVQRGFVLNTERSIGINLTHNVAFRSVLWGFGPFLGRLHESCGRFTWNDTACVCKRTVQLSHCVNAYDVAGAAMSPLFRRRLFRCFCHTHAPNWPSSLFKHKPPHTRRATPPRRFTHAKNTHRIPFDSAVKCPPILTHTLRHLSFGFLSVMAFSVLRASSNCGNTTGGGRAG